jgi:hypothetical protein
LPRDRDCLGGSRPVEKGPEREIDRRQMRVRETEERIKPHYILISRAKRFPQVGEYRE